MSKNCEICDNDKFENLDGYYYCTICGTKSQVDFNLNNKIYFIFFFHQDSTRYPIG